MTISQLFHFQSQTITSSAGLLILSALISRILGLARNMLLSWRFGASETTDIYLAAFRIPDFISSFFIVGGISVVFVPLFSEYFQKDQKAAWIFANNLLNVVIVILVALSLLAFFLTPFLLNMLIPGFTPDQKAMTVALTRLMLLSPILLGVSAIFSGILQYFQRFFTYSLAPILYNLGIIGGILFLYPIFGISGLGLGVVGGTLLHLVVKLPAVLHSGFRWKPLVRISDPSIFRVGKLIFPRTIAAIGQDLNVLVITALASLISVGSITIFTFADDIRTIPVGLIGSSFALASFPVFSRLFVSREIDRFRQAFSSTLRHTIFFVVPISVLLFLLRAQIIRIVYGTSEKFGWEETRLAAAVLGIFAFGILFHSLIPLFVRTFFAFQDTKTPTLTSLLGVSTNIILALVFLHLLSSPTPLHEAVGSILKLTDLKDFRIVALPLALFTSTIVQFLLLLWLLSKRIPGIVSREIFISFCKVVGASLALGGVAYLILKIYGSIFPLRTYEGVLAQMSFAAIGGIFAFSLVAFLLKSPEFLQLLELVTANFRKRRKRE